MKSYNLRKKYIYIYITFKNKFLIHTKLKEVPVRKRHINIKYCIVF